MTTGNSILKKTNLLLCNVGVLSTMALCSIIAHETNLWVAKLVLTVLLCIWPGFLILLVLGINKVASLLTFWIACVLSIFFLMLTGLAIDITLPLFGVAKPLTFSNILVGIFTSAFVMSLVIFLQNRELDISWKAKFNRYELLCLLWATSLPIIAVGGAFRLNNGGSNIVSQLALLLDALLIVYTVITRKYLKDNAFIWAIFGIGLSVLLMTSLRGWYITGHDIKREFQVFQLTQQSSHWDPLTYHSAYYACLSITILPVVFTNLLHISGIWVFKLIFQILFTLCPIGMYFLLRKYLPQVVAFLGVILFISFPTYVNDMAMLTRQEIAYVFFVGAILILMGGYDFLSSNVQKILFFILALGVITSHYSTAYMFLAIIAFGLLFSKLLKRVVTENTEIAHRSLLSLTSLTLLVLTAFLWFSQVTYSSGGLAKTLESSISNIGQMLQQDNRGGGTQYAILNSTHESQSTLLANFVQASSNGQANYPLVIQDNGVIPYTSLGNYLAKLGLNPGSEINESHSIIARLFQLIPFLGIGILLVTKLRRKYGIPLDFIGLCIACLLVLGLQVMLPTISLDYGLLRAYQQCLILLAVPMMIFFVALMRKLGTMPFTLILVAFTLFIFVNFTGLLPESIGGTEAQLDLNNYGYYYGAYYTTKGDVAGYDWLYSNAPANTPIQTENYDTARMTRPYYPFYTEGILPSQLLPNSVIFLDHAQVVDSEIYVYVQGTPVEIVSPTKYYQTARDQIYSNETAQIFYNK